MVMPYSANAVIFSPVLAADSGADEATKQAAASGLRETSEDLFLGSSRVRRRRAEQVLQAIRANSAEVNLTSDMLYTVLAETDEDIDDENIDVPQNQLALLSLIEHNPQVRAFFLRDIFGNDAEEVKVSNIKLSADTSLSFNDFTPEFLRSQLSEDDFNEYQRNRRAWLRNAANEEKINTILSTAATAQVRIISQESRKYIVAKLYQDVAFGYSFFSRWNIPRDTATINPQTLRNFARRNPGAALGILMNSLLSDDLKTVLTTTDKRYILSYAAEQTAVFNRKHYFRVTLMKLLPFTTPDELNLAEFLRAAPDPLELLEDLVRDASKYRTPDQKNLYDALAAQAGNIVTQSSNEIPAGEVTKLMGPLVANLIQNYAVNKTDYQARQLETLFNHHPELVEKLHLGEAMLRSISTDEAFLIRNNPDHVENPRKKHPFKSFFNRVFGAFKDIFTPAPNNLALLPPAAIAAAAVAEPVAAAAPDVAPAVHVAQPAPIVAPAVSVAAEPASAVKPIAMEPAQEARVTVQTTMETEQEAKVTVHPATMEREHEPKVTTIPEEEFSVTDRSVAPTAKRISSLLQEAAYQEEWKIIPYPPELKLPVASATASSDYGVEPGTPLKPSIKNTKLEEDYDVGFDTPLKNTEDSFGIGTKTPSEEDQYSLGETTPPAKPNTKPNTSFGIGAKTPSTHHFISGNAAGRITVLDSDDEDDFGLGNTPTKPSVSAAQDDQSEADEYGVGLTPKRFT